MSTDRPFSTQDFGASFKGFLDRIASSTDAEAPIFVRLLSAHFETDPTQLPIVTQQFEKSDQPNVQNALEAYLDRPECRAELMGIGGPEKILSGLSQLVVPGSVGLMGGSSPQLGPVEYSNILLDADRVKTCVQSGLYLIRVGQERLAVLVKGPSQLGFPPNLSIDVMARQCETAEAFLAHLRTEMRRHNVYRGRTISLQEEKGGTVTVQFHQLRSIERANLILPEALLARIERQTLGFARASEMLRAAGQHLKRGLLLYGPPGTGKTLTMMYLASQMPDRTTILITGGGVGSIEQSCTMARLLQPATIVLEDVDLIAEERTHQSKNSNAILFEMLNQMDGLADDADVLFLLTTNRPEILEPALASRPGRVDQAIEIPLPDAECRQRLFELYSQGLVLQIQNLPSLVERCRGVSAAFIRELVRKAALFAADERSELCIRDEHLEAAFQELMFDGGELTKQLLGVARQSAPRP
ncbi:AAA family ATPase [Chamaesiphon polymorphus]|uniref:AAA+ ATPase domain-containing protein n=1 Tax=Chamaesiphon polymorphus CCALA 037 TaxID=2107692 RepID=A0A2T1GCR7_9CYAN|nr:ATP-binding protein [Chamaesiphon polymorphus]PSB55183.1 hypothetical protein C7B77_15835 [Chamaesiphon polymorphus CCALA 037]